MLRTSRLRCAALRVQLGRPHAGSIVVQPVGWVREVADDGAAARRLRCTDARRAHGCGAHMQQPLKVRVKPGHQRALQAVRAGVKDVCKAANVAAAVGGDALRCWRVRIRAHQALLVRHLPCLRAGMRQQVAPGQHARPQFFRRVRARQQAGLPDNRDRPKVRHGAAAASRNLPGSTPRRATCKSAHPSRPRNQCPTPCRHQPVHSRPAGRKLFRLCAPRA